MNVQRQYDVFISYATANLEFARLVKRAIEILGFRVFLADSSIAPGQHLPTIRGHLQRARLMVLLWSEDASKSEWVRDEVGAAWGANVPVVPVVLSKGVTLPPSLSAAGVKYLDGTAQDTKCVLDIQAAVIAWWQDQLNRHAAQVAAFEEQRRRQQQEATGQFLGLAALGALFFAAAKK